MPQRPKQRGGPSIKYPSLQLSKLLRPASLLGSPGAAAGLGWAAGGDARQGMRGSIPGEEAGFGALVLRPGLENVQSGSFLFGKGRGRGRRAPRRGQWCGTVKIKRMKEKTVMKKKLMKGKEVVSAEAGAYEMSPESSVFSHPGGLGVRKEGGMLARWDTWAGTSLQK